MIDDPLSIVRKFPDTCCAETTRKGESQPCDKPAYLVAHDPEEDDWWPVCRYHSMKCQRVLTLAELIKALT